MSTPPPAPSSGGLRDELAIVRRLIPLLGPSRMTLPLIVGLGVVSSILESVGLYLFLPLLALLSGTADGLPAPVAAAVESIPRDLQVPVLVGLVVLTVAVKNAITFANSAYFARVEAATGDRIRRDLFSVVLSASYAHTVVQPSGRIPNAVLSETWRVARALAALYTLVINAVGAVILVAVLFYISFETTLLAVPLLGGVMAVLQLVTRQARREGDQAVAANTAFANRAWESLNGLRSIRLFGRRAYEEERFAAASDRVRHHFLRLDLLQNLIMPTFETLIALAIGVWIVVLDRSEAGVPTIAVFLLVLYRLQPRVRGVMGARVSLMEYGGAVEELEAVRREATASRLPSGPRTTPRPWREIRFDKVAARYPGSTGPAVVDLDLVIPARRTTAIVGPSGAGKTTILHLLCRELDPTAGTVTVDGVPLEEIATDDWRGRLAVVSQDIHLFNATVAENIRYGRLDATPAEVEAAARLAHAHDFVERLPQGYDTEAGDDGQRLSGGQRQRIALARALVRDPDVLILDEATNALDSHAEEQIQDALDRLARTMTIVVVAHRLSTIVTADQIVMMENGRVVERGGFDALMRRNGAFARLFRTQARQADAAEPGP